MPDGIVLVGLPGSGKTTIGRLVAERLGRLFIDIDAQIEHQTGRSSGDLIAAEGEPAFRELEREAVRKACTVRGAVIAAGGGTPLDPLNRWELKEHGIRIRLDADVFELARRLEMSGIRRPLLGDALVDGLSRAQTEREGVYEAVDIVVNGDASPESVVAEVIDAAASVDSAAHWRTLYSARFPRHDPREPEHGHLRMGTGLTRPLLDAWVGTLAGANPAALVDARAIEANPSIVAGFPTTRMCTVPGGEEAKTTARLEQILSWLTSISAERTDPLVVVGGGSLGDVGGLAASLHLRGMPLVQIPTTWLAQADSAIGGKVAIDLPGAKNAVGTFWPAWLIVSDAKVVETLPIDERRNGIAECLKAGLIGDPDLWALVEERGEAALNGQDAAAAYAITERAARVKLDIVNRDPFERGERRVLNLGHTLGHALEAESRYTLAHGIAVALGLRAVAAIAYRRGAEADLAPRIDSVLSELGFPLHREFDGVAVRAALGHDKKREAGRQRWILPLAVGHVEEVDDVSDEELAAALAVISA
jgi:shikimate kinase/3-dehydroquinate synthase